MESLSLTFEIRFSQSTPLVGKKLVEITLGREPQREPSGIKGLEINHLPSKTRAIMANNRIAMVVENPEISEAKTRLFELLETTYGEADYGRNKIARIGVKTQWIHPWGGSFATLFKRYKEVFYKDSSLLKESLDIAVFLTLKDNGYKVNYATGPMKPDEAKTRLIFKKRELPHDFIFIDIDRYASNHSPNNNLRDIKRFISSSIDYGLNKANETLDILSMESITK